MARGVVKSNGVLGVETNANSAGTRAPTPLPTVTTTSTPVVVSAVSVARPFTGVSRDEVFRQAEARAQPGGAALIDQGYASLCGPAVFMYLLAKHRPGVYENYVKVLVARGEAKIGDLHVQPGDACRAHNPGSTIAAADWVALAGLRDSENTFLDYAQSGNEVAGITLPSKLASWLTKAGFSGVRDHTASWIGGLYLTSGKSSFFAAIDEMHKGRAVILLINADGIRNVPPGRGFFSQLATLPSHWVVLMCVDSSSSKNLKFEVYSWGSDKHKVPNAPGATLAIEDWLQNYYGYVSCDV